MKTVIRAMATMCLVGMVMAFVTSCEDSDSDPAPAPDPGVSIRWSGFGWEEYENDPTLTEFSISENVGATIYYTVSFANLDTGHVYEKMVTIKQNGTVVYDNTSYFDLGPEDGSVYTSWIGWDIVPTDPAGTWTFTHYLDGEKVDEGQITALP